MNSQIFAGLVLSMLASSTFALPAPEKDIPLVKPVRWALSQTVAADGSERTPQGQILAEGGGDRTVERSSTTS